MTQVFKFELHIRGLDQQGKFVIPLGETVIGRGKDADLPLPHDKVSRRHARITCDSTACRIADLGSTNGTWLNGEKLPGGQVVPLSDGDRIEIEPFALTFKRIPVLAAQPAESGLGVAGAGQLPPTPPQRPGPEPAPAAESGLPGGLATHSRYLLDYLPPIYHTDFLARFLALFESLLMPIKWSVDGFDLYLDAGTAPASFLSWLSGWLDMAFDPTWSEAQRRKLLKAAPWLYARRGTRPALRRALAIYTGYAEEDIHIEDANRAPFTFAIRLPGPPVDKQAHIRAIIDAYKPAHTSYMLEFGR